MELLETYSPDGKNIVERAREIATRRNHNFIGTEHLILAIVFAECKAHTVLAQMGLDTHKIYTDTENQIGKGPDQKLMGNLPFTPRVRKCLEIALDVARSFAHTEIESDHLLIALLLEGGGVAARVLRSHGVEPELLRQTVLKCRTKGTGEAPEEKTVPSAATLIGAEGLGETVTQRLISALRVQRTDVNQKFAKAARILRIIALDEIATLNEHVKLKPDEKTRLTAAIIDVTQNADDLNEIKVCFSALRRVVDKHDDLMEILRKKLRAMNNESPVKLGMIVPSDVRKIGSLMQIANAGEPIAITLNFLSLWDKPPAQQ